MPQPQYDQLFEYLSAPLTPTGEQPTLVFGRQDALLAIAMATTEERGHARYYVVSGGIGKDSGNLAELGITEAEFVAQGLPDESVSGAVQLGVSADKIVLDTVATNGGENARNGLTIISSPSFVALSGLKIATEFKAGDPVTALAHATSLRRLAALLSHEAISANIPIGTVNMIPTAYSFNRNDPADRAEALAEMMRLIDWPEKNWLQPQTDMPEDLREFAIAEAAKAKKLSDK